MQEGTARALLKQQSTINAVRCGSRVTRPRPGDSVSMLSLIETIRGTASLFLLSPGAAQTGPVSAQCVSGCDWLTFHQRFRRWLAVCADLLPAFSTVRPVPTKLSEEKTKQNNNNKHPHTPPPITTTTNNNNNNKEQQKHMDVYTNRAKMQPQFNRNSKQMFRLNCRCIFCSISDNMRRG